jgi:hypothetical protein
VGKNRRTRNKFRQVDAPVLVKPRKYTASEVYAYLARAAKRAEKAAGVDTDKPKSKWAWDCCTKQGVVEAHTRSEARSLIKKELGLKKRLPIGFKMEKVDE